MTIQTTIIREGVEIPIEVTGNYMAASRGHRDKYGAPEEPDTKAEIEVCDAVVVETKPGYQNGTVIELTESEVETIEGEMWKKIEADLPDPQPDPYDYDIPF